jgi:hypothetical protein
VARSVLRVADQVAGVFPDRCVLSGVHTTRAVRLTATQFGGPRWLLGVLGFAKVVGWLPGHERCTVALPVSVRVWRIWRVRNVMAVSTLSVGLTCVAIGGAAGAVNLGLFGAALGVVAVICHARTNHNYWVTCSLHPSSATIVIEPTHQRFDDAARDLFTRTLM